MRPLRTVPLLITLAAASGCSSATKSVPPSPSPPASRTSGPQLVWTGSLQPTQERSGAVVPTKQQKAYGTVRLQPAAQDLNRTVVSIVISTPVQEPTELRWAIVPGRCGAGALPLVGHEQFPVLEIGANGRGQLTAEIPFAMPYDGAYHLNVYLERTQSGAADLQNVLTCANLRRGGGS
jgi:hypothetical protein